MINSKIKERIVREYVAEVLKYRNNDKILKVFNRWVAPIFPRVEVSTLNKNGVTTPKLYSVVINGLKNYWADHNFQISDEDIAREIPIILDNINLYKSEFSKKNKRA